MYLVVPRTCEDARVKLEEYIRTIPDYPKPGILFRDVSTLLGSAPALAAAVEQLCAPYRDSNGSSKVAFVAGIEARGFTIGGAMAVALGAGFIPIRKAGKLPAATHSQDYELEYGTDTLEMHIDAVSPGDSVLLVDDLIATGGTAAAAVSLLQRVEANIVAAAFIIDLPDLGGMVRLADLGIETHALLNYPGH